MTRYKKELSKRGYKLECEYNYLPFPYTGKESTCKGIYIDTVITGIVDNFIVYRMITNVIDSAVYIDNTFSEVKYIDY